MYTDLLQCCGPTAAASLNVRFFESYSSLQHTHLVISQSATPPMEDTLMAALLAVMLLFVFIKIQGRQEQDTSEAIDMYEKCGFVNAVVRSMPPL